MCAEKKFEPTWESLQQYEIPAWYADGKFGIFIHWGAYAVPAFANEWYPRNMYIQGSREYEHHVKTYGPHTEFGYKDFIPMFRAEKFDADGWAELFRESGARFVVPVAEHHDGFAMYDCSTSRWTSVHMGPQRDIVGELAQAVRARGMVFGVSTHRAEHWWFMNGGRNFPSDVQDPAFDDFYGPAVQHEDCDGTAQNTPSLTSQPYPSTEYLEDWLARTVELVDKYQPQLVWFDWWIGHAAFPEYLKRFAAHYYNRGQEWDKGVAINYKYEAYQEGTAVLDVERGQLSDIRPLLWQNDTSVAKNSWSYVVPQDYKTAESLIQDLVDVVSKNGALLLNIGPRPDGTIPEPEQAILREIGAWLAVNGEAIYGTRPWELFGEGPTEVTEGAFTDTKRAPFTAADFRFTTKGDALYAICLAWPGETATIHALRAGSPLLDRRVVEVALLGAPGALAWSVEANGLKIRMPAAKPCDHAYSFKIRLE
ncbi:MAG: alpha-L-fucosidase [Caldilineaceae bacterium]|nr:alpha-L-fucosidase [Caldilineaceae bacterium]MCB9120136.1 alpha-L-fucosidase [Caldilineaceae bacterium]